MRSVLRALCEEKSPGDLSTIEDGANVERIKKALEEMGQTGKQAQPSSSPLGGEQRDCSHKRRGPQAAGSDLDATVSAEG